MTLMQKRSIILLVIVIVAIVSGRLAVRGIMNLLLRGTMFVWEQLQKEQE